MNIMLNSKLRLNLQALYFNEQRKPPSKNGDQNFLYFLIN